MERFVFIKPGKATALVNIVKNGYISASLNMHIIITKVAFPFVHSGQPKNTGSGQVQGERLHNSLNFRALADCNG